MKRYYNDDKSIRILNPDEVPDSRHIGKLTNDLHSSKWEKASKDTLEDLFKKGALNQSQIENLHELGIDIKEIALEGKLQDLDLASDEDFEKFISIAQNNPKAIRMMNKIDAKRKRNFTREKNKDLKEQIMKINFDTAEGLEEFAALVKQDSDAIKIFKKLNLKE